MIELVSSMDELNDYIIPGRGTLFSSDVLPDIIDDGTLPLESICLHTSGQLYTKTEFPTVWIEIGEFPDFCDPPCQPECQLQLVDITDDTLVETGFLYIVQSYDDYGRCHESESKEKYHDHQHDYNPTMSPLYPDHVCTVNNHNYKHHHHPDGHRGVTLTLPLAANHEGESVAFKLKPYQHGKHNNDLKYGYAYINISGTETIDWTECELGLGKSNLYIKLTAHNSNWIIR